MGEGGVGSFVSCNLVVEVIKDALYVACYRERETKNNSISGHVA
jgi:hypothetical protein